MSNKKGFTAGNEKGFTLIEIVMVIVLLGILAAVAIPRFANLSQSARASTVDGLYGTIQGASAMVYAQSLIEGETALAVSSVTMEGQAIVTAYGYPDDTAGGIDVALSAYDGFTFAAGPPALFTNDSDATPVDCRVEYTEPAAVNARPTIASVNTCL